MGIQIATSIRVGQYLGAGNPVGAMTTGRLGITLVCESLKLSSRDRTRGPGSTCVRVCVRARVRPLLHLDCSKFEVSHRGAGNDKILFRFFNQESSQNT